MSYSYKGILYKYLVNNGVELDKDVYFYGLTAFMNYFLYFVILLPFAIIFDIFFEILVFLIFFVPLRRYIGGYHFNSKKLCLIFSVVFTVLISYIAVFTGRIQPHVRLICIILMIIVTNTIKAVDNPNKRISVKEKTVYTNKSLKIEILYSILILFFYNSFTYVYLNIAFFCMVFCTLSILIARLEELRYTR